MYCVEHIRKSEWDRKREKEKLGNVDLTDLNNWSNAPYFPAHTNLFLTFLLY